ncbi:MAG: hypothetical protein AAGB12_12410 [Pseudomonadota bacterium]
MMHTNIIDFIIAQLKDCEQGHVRNDFFPRTLYTSEQLFEGFNPQNQTSYNNTLDGQMMAYAEENNETRSLLMESLHDVFIDSYLREFVKGRKIIGIMGHACTLRTATLFREISFLCRSLALNGFDIIHGGGPGVMEAAALGAYFANYTEKDLEEAISILKQAPNMADELYRSKAFEVIKKYPLKQKNGVGIAIAVPTWAFITEPTSIFSSVFAKYFDDGRREYALLNQSNCGIIFGPGGAGTLQEFFEGTVIDYTIKSGLPFVIYDVQDKGGGNLEKLALPVIKLIYKDKKMDLLFTVDQQKAIDFFRR